MAAEAAHPPPLSTAESSTGADRAPDPEPCPDPTPNASATGATSSPPPRRVFGGVAEVRATATAGRGLFVLRTLTPGTLLCSERPYAFRLPLSASGERSGHCHQCAAGSVQLKRCSACKGPLYCSAACQRAGWRGHREECASIQRVAPHTPPSALLLMAAVLRKGGGAEAPEITGLAGSREDLDDGAKEELAGLVVLMKRFLPEDALPEARVAFDLLCKLRCNTFSICDPELQPIGAGLYPQCSLLNHSCLPNCVATFRGTQLQLRALRPIPAGTELTISYIDTLAPRQHRLASLRQQYAFTCTCPQCVPLTGEVAADGGAARVSVEPAVDALLVTVRCSSCSAESVPKEHLLGGVSSEISPTDGGKATDHSDSASTSTPPRQTEGAPVTKDEQGDGVDVCSACGVEVPTVGDEAIKAACEGGTIPAPGTPEAAAELKSLGRRVEVWKAHLGPTHVVRLRGMQRLADLQIGAALWPDALATVTAIVDGLEKVLPSDSPALALELARLGKLQHYLGHCRLAAVTLSRAARALGVSHGGDATLVAGLAREAAEAAQEAAHTPEGLGPPAIEH